MRNKFTVIALVGTVLQVIASAASGIIPLFIASSVTAMGVLVALTQVEDRK